MRQAIIFNRHRKMRALKAARVIGDRLVDRKEEKLVNLVLNCRVFVTFLAIFSLIALSGSQSLAGPFISYPGARARAMGGAFTGIADDASAVWFNPAGLAQEKDEEGITDVIIDWSQAASIDEKDGPLRSDENAWFVGGKFNYEEFGIGLYYYTPYSIKYWAYDQGQNDAAWGKVNEIVQTIGIPAAVSLIDGRLKLGATIDLVHLSIHDSRVYYRDNWGWVDAYPTAKENTNGLAGSLGTLITLIDNKPRSFDLKLGGTYRLKSQTDIGAAALKAGEDVAVAQLFFDRPESFDVGVSWGFLVFVGGGFFLFRFFFLVWLRSWRLIANPVVEPLVVFSADVYSAGFVLCEFSNGLADEFAVGGGVRQTESFAQVLCFAGCFLAL